MNNVIDLLDQRGFIDAVTSDKLKTQANSPLKVYCGFDPTSDSLHLGNLIAIMGLAWFQRCGHTPIALIGGATGMIGDPSGKKKERVLLSEEIIEKNAQGIQKNLTKFLNFSSGDNPALLLNNFDWLGKCTFIEFLRDTGKWFRLGPMLSKESVKSRMESEEGISFTEFSYQLMQAYDFLYLFDAHDVTVQMGGSDQWGNITAGIDLIRKKRQKNAYGLTFPLLLSSEGEKLGKSENGAIWLSKEKTSPFDFYQYLYRIPDQDVIRLMRLLTFMDLEEITDFEKQMKASNYLPNSAQKRLAEEVTRLVHGEEGLQDALSATQGLKPGGEAVLDAKSFEALAKTVPLFVVKRESIVDRKVIDLLADQKVLASKGDVRRLIRQGGLSLNNQKVTEENFVIPRELLIEQKWLLVAMGKKNKVLICAE